MAGLLTTLKAFIGRATGRAEALGPVASLERAGNAAERDDHDYLWRKAKLAAQPSTNRARDLPILGSTIFDEVGSVRAALTSLELGQFWQAAQLVDAFGADDRIHGVEQTRVDALFGLPLETELRSTDAKAEEYATRVRNEWPTWFADAEIKKFLKWGLELRVAVGELLWDTSSPGTWTPRFKTWDPRFLYWRWDTRTFWMITMDGPIEITPGDGHWVLYCPDGYARGWMGGHVRSLALMYLVRRWALRDWARFSEVHGLPIKKATVPAGLPPEDKEAFLADLETLGSEGLVRLAVDENGKGFDLALMEAQSQSWEGFQKLLEKADECIAIDLLGQNLTTSIKGGGSYAAANVHDRIRLDRVEADSKSLGDCLSEQVVVPWAVYNFGRAEFAPRARWSTKVEEQRGVTADTWNKLGDALKKLKDAGLPVDLAVVAEIFKVPLQAVVDLTERGQLYEYHLKYGVVTKNEARARLGLPSRPDGDVYASAPAEDGGSKLGGLGDKEPEEDADVEEKTPSTPEKKPEPEESTDANSESDPK